MYRPSVALDSGRVFEESSPFSESITSAMAEVREVTTALLRKSPRVSDERIGSSTGTRLTASKQASSRCAKKIRTSLPDEPTLTYSIFLDHVEPYITHDGKERFHTQEGNLYSRELLKRKGYRFVKHGHQELVYSPLELQAGLHLMVSTCTKFSPVNIMINNIAMNPVQYYKKNAIYVLYSSLQTGYQSSDGRIYTAQQFQALRFFRPSFISNVCDKMMQFLKHRS